MDILIGQLADLRIATHQGDKTLHIRPMLGGGVNLLPKLHRPFRQYRFLVLIARGQKRKLLIRQAAKAMSS